MNIPHIAKAILASKNMSNIVMPGHIRSLIGEDGYRHAVQQHWLVADYEYGHLQITEQASLLFDMRALAALAEADPVYQVGEDVTTVENGQAFDGKVSQVNPDGTYAVSFPGARKPLARTSYMTAQLTRKAQPVGGVANPYMPKPVQNYTTAPSQPAAAPRA